MTSACGLLAVVQARMSSSRLPGKVLADIGGEPALELLLKRLTRAEAIGDIVVATSREASDEPVAQLASRLGTDIVRGPLEDVLGRFVLALGDRTGPIIRITGDCPLIDPRVVDATAAQYLRTAPCVYACNFVPRTYPDGLDVEVVDADVLRTLADEDLSSDDREHVTLAVRAQPHRFPATAVCHSCDLGILRWTLDDSEDLTFLRAVVERLGRRRYEAGVEEIHDAVRAPPSLDQVGRSRRG